MADSNMDSQALRVFTLHSHKGGVGKTSLATAIAGLESSRRRVKTLLIDADLTGTCILDALNVDAGHARPRESFSHVLLADPDRFLGLTQRPRARPGGPTKCQEAWHEFLYAHSFLNRAEPDFHIVPSPATPAQVREIIPSLAQEHLLHFYADRFREVLLALTAQGFRSIVVDLPPGLFGLSESVFGLVSDPCLAAEVQQARASRLEAWPIVVTSADRMDYRATFRFIVELEEEVASLGDRDSGATVPWFNRAVPMAGQSRVDEPMLLGPIFDDLQSMRGGEVLDGLRSRCKGGRGGAFPFVPDFAVHRILPTLSNLLAGQAEGRPEDVRPTISTWLCDVAARLGYDSAT